MATYNENARDYGTYKCSWDDGNWNQYLAQHGSYQLPVDETELDRLDIMNAMLRSARKSVTTAQPSNDLTNIPTQMIGRPKRPDGEPPRVLDLGCGTGIWMIEMANDFPDAQFLGLDINAMQPSTLGPRITVEVPVDIEQEGDFGPEDWDMIHLQLGLGSVHDWSGLYRKALRSLRPGTGWFESVEIDWEPRCYHAPLPADGKLTIWWRNLSDAFQAAGRPLHYDRGTREKLEAAGFRDIQCQRYIVPMSGWSRDPFLQHTGMWWHIAMSNVKEDRSGYGLHAMSLAMLTRMHRWPLAHVHALLTDALVEARDTPNAYNALWVWWARAPGPGED